MTRTLALVLALVLTAGGVAWWLSAAAQPVTVDSIGDENQTLARRKLPVFAATQPGSTPSRSRRGKPSRRSRAPAAASGSDTPRIDPAT